MPDDCARFRSALSRGGRTGDHADSCAGCAAFAERWTAVERELAPATSDATPPPGFATRLRSRLPQPPHPVVAVSLRVLPATLTLLAAAGLWIAITGPIDVGEQPGSTDEYLEWMVDDVLADAALLEGDPR